MTAFLAEGFTVIAAARDPASIERRENVIPVKIDSLDPEGPKKVGRSLPLHLDLGLHPDDAHTLCVQAVEELRTQHGISQIDIVLANAGVFPDQGLFVQLSAESAEHVWRVNVRPPSCPAWVGLDPGRSKFADNKILRC